MERLSAPTNYSRMVMGWTATNPKCLVGLQTSWRGQWQGNKSISPLISHLISLSYQTNLLFNNCMKLKILMEVYNQFIVKHHHWSTISLFPPLIKVSFCFHEITIILHELWFSQMQVVECQFRTLLSMSIKSFSIWLKIRGWLELKFAF